MQRFIVEETRHEFAEFIANKELIKAVHPKAFTEVKKEWVKDTLKKWGVLDKASFSFDLAGEYFDVCSADYNTTIELKEEESKFFYTYQLTLSTLKGRII